MDTGLGIAKAGGTLRLGLVSGECRANTPKSMGSKTLVRSLAGIDSNNVEPVLSGGIPG